ncbi:MAG: hypothetical protein OEV21_04940 [Thermoplasmata archaeon]|nr:hypothetical protein [Thermoplasmata archaeon]
MQIKGFDVNSIDAKRYTKPGEKIQNLRIDNNSTVISVSLISDSLASLEFRFTANYSSIGVIKIEGRILLEGEAKTLQEMWSKTNNMPPEVANVVHSAVITNCMPVAVVVSKDIGLPPPLPPIQPLQMPKKPSAKDTRRNSPEIT